MFTEAWNTIKEWFTAIYRFLAYGETKYDKAGVYLFMFFLIAILFILSLSVKKGKGRPINSPFLFLVAVGLTIFTINL